MSDTKPIRVRDQDERLPYRLREAFLSTPERALLRVLQSMAGRHYMICPKVSLRFSVTVVQAPLPLPSPAR